MLTQALARSASSKQTAPHIRPVPAVGSHALEGNIELMGASMSFTRNAEIYGEGEPADYLYKVISGTVRTYKVLSDGRRQIGAFYMPGDVFGLETSDEHTFSAEAICDSKVLVIKRSTLVALAGRDTEVARQLWALTGRELSRVKDHILLLNKTVQNGVVGFLLEMAEGASNNGALELPMSRQDIADYLGLTIETVSRTLTTLENAGVFEVPTSRRIVLRNRSALNRLNAWAPDRKARR